ncbi:MAG: SdpI family protein [Anaerolineaceae bacterium]|nr:SdpI family protein [Anaerolineaceae bacterium]
MKMRTVLIILGVLLILSLGTGVYAYPHLPQLVASHWNAQGQVNGYTSRLSGVLLLPAMLLGISLVLLFIPEIDPLKANIQLFRPEYNGFIAVFALFMFYLHLVTVAINLGLAVSMNQLLFPAFGLLIIYMGFLLSKAHRNYFIGIRTPWTLNSETVWNKTHQLGSKLFTIAGAITLLGVFFPNYAVYILLIAITATALITTVYSYFAFRQESQSKP